jgi:glycosyltransferase involved in cell wall biosynthesis
MKKKVLIFTDAFSGGGAEEVMKQFATELRQDFEVLHISKWLGPKQIILQEDMINLNKPSSKECLPSLYKIVKAFKPDFIFSSTGHNNMIVLLLKLFLINKPKVIIRESSVASVMKNYSFKSKALDFLLMRPLYKTADAIIAQSKDIARDLKEVYKLPKEKIVIINNPIGKDLIKSSGPDNGTIKLLTIGRFSPEKGYDRLLKILQKLPNYYTLQIMGDGLLLKQTKQKGKELGVDDRLTFLGFLDEVEKLKVMHAADLYIQASYVEGFPNSLLQSVAMGLPVVAFDVPGGTREIIKEINGCLVKDGEIDLMVQCIKEINLKEYDSILMQKDALERFGISKIMKDLRQVFNKLSNGK